MKATRPSRRWFSIYSSCFSCGLLLLCLMRSALQQWGMRDGWAQAVTLRQSLKRTLCENTLHWLCTRGAWVVPQKISTATVVSEVPPALVQRSCARYRSRYRLHVPSLPHCVGAGKLTAHRHPFSQSFSHPKEETMNPVSPSPSLP